MVQKVQNCFPESPNLPKKKGSDVHFWQINSRRTGPFSLPLQEPNHSLTPLTSKRPKPTTLSSRGSRQLSVRILYLQATALVHPIFSTPKIPTKPTSSKSSAAPSTQGPGLDLCTFLTQNATNKPGSSTNLAEAPEKN